MPVEVGVGYVSIVPETRGFGRLLERQIAGEAARAGEAAGQQSGRGFLSGIGGAVKGGVVAVAAGAGALFAAGFAEAIEQDKSNARLGAALGLSEGESARLGKVAGKVYASGYGESIDQVNDALKGLAQNGVAAVNAPKRELAGLSKAALNLAETFDADVGESAAAAGQLIKTGLVKDGKAAFDLLTRGFQTGADKAGDLVDTVNEYSTQFRDLGLTGSQAVGLLTQGLKAGARDSDIVADALKEFAIRAKDGSDTTKAGFDAIGLSADKMAQTFAKGGPGAAKALDTVLDRLRAIKDPAKRSQVAISLFGTQAEDLQQSLFSLDPSKATDALGKVSGAAGRMGKTLHGSATQQLEVFKRQALQGVAEFAAKYALPAVQQFGSFLNTYVLPSARTVGGALVDVLVPAVKWTGEAFAGGIQWLKDYGAWLLPLGVAVGGLAVTMGASAIATGAATAVFSVYRGVILAASAVTRGWTIAQAALNAVMSANPVGLIITAVLALGAALYVAWQKSATFRSIVMGAWEGIKTAALGAWTGFIKPALDGLWAGLQKIGQAASWLWSTVLSPVFSFIGTAAKVLFAIVVVAVVTPMVLAFKAFGAVASWLWTNAIGPAFRAIGAVASWLYVNMIKPAFTLASLAFRALGAAGSWLYANAIKPAISAIGSVITWLYTNVVRPYISGAQQTFRALGSVASWLYHSAIQPAMRGIGAAATWLYANAIKPAITSAQMGFRLLGAAGSWLYRTAIKPAFDGIGSIASWLWTKALKPALDAGKKAVGMFGRSFETAKDAIGKAWGKVQAIAAKPVNFIIEWVYTKGIKKVWDSVAGFVGLDPLPKAPKLLAAGGTVGNGWGPAEPMQVSRPTAIVGEGNPRHPEFVIPTDPKCRGRARALWEAAGTQLMADGGIIGSAVDWIGGAARKIGGVVMDGVDFLSDPSKMWSKATAFIRDKVKQIGSSTWAQVLARVPGRMLGGLKDKIVEAAKKLFGGSSAAVGGSGVQRWSSVVLQALKLVGQPASLLPVVLRRMNQESGGNPRAINNWDINAKAGDPSRGLMQTIGSTFNAYAGKLRSRGIYDPLANIYASMRYALARYGSLAAAYNRPGGYAGGGRPQPNELAWVGERGPELVRFRGGETVYDHKTSLGMAAGLGVRGFASGTTGARARREVPGDLQSFTKSLTGSSSSIGKAAKSLAADLKAAGGAGRRLASTTDKTSSRLQSLAKSRDSVESKLTAATTAAADQKKSAADYLGLSNVGSPTSVAELITGMQSRQSTLKGFQAQIKTAQRKGVSQNLISQLVAAGPDSNLGQLVAGASAAQIKQLNALMKSGTALSTSYGNTLADAMYDAGSQAGRGFLTGLKAQEAELQKQMNKLGAGLVTSIKRSLKIKSPSRVMRDEVGEQTGAGVVAGMVRTLPQIESAAARMATAAVPAVVPVASAQQPARPAGLQRGDTLVLRVGEREFVAVVDERVDAGLSEVRRRGRAGAKGR